MIYAFARFELDDELYELRCGEAIVRLEPKVFDVLAYLIRHRAHVVSKDELLDALWHGEFVSDSVLPRCIAAARRALADARHAPTFIATIHGRGYRFLADVTETARGTRSDPEPVEPTRHGRGLFVGREAALAQLRESLSEAMEGRGRLLLLVGEPGIGKTRTAEELAAEAVRRGVRIAIGRCYEGFGTPAFWLWVQILRACALGRDPLRLRGELGPGAPELAELVPELRQQLADLPVSRAIPPEQARFRLFDSIACFLQRSSAAQPLMLVLDDLHWADASSLQVLQFLARELRSAHLLLIGAYRDIDLRRDHPFAQTLGELAREPLCQRILLRGLDEADVQRYVEHGAGQPVSAGLVAAVHQMTEGNPFFVGEVVRWLASRGRLTADEGDASAWNLVLPQGIREAIGRRLSTLSEECNQVLTAAAVIGREFNVTTLAHLTGRDREDLLVLLDEACRARVVGQSAGLGVYGFSHTLIRQTLYEELSAPRRVLLHRRVGEVLQALHGGDPEPHLAALADHFFQAATSGDVDTAIDYSTRAAQRAVRLLAYEEAAAHFARALELLDLKAASDDDGRDRTVQRCELLLAVGEAHSGAGNRTASQQFCRTAAQLARRLGRADLLARAALGFGQRAELGPLPAEELRQLLDEAVRELRETEYAWRARVTSRLAGTAPYQHSMETRAALSSQAVALAERSGDTDALFDALAARLWACMGPDQDEARLQVTAEVAALAERSGQPERMLMVHEHRIRSFLSAGDMAAADREQRTYTALAGELRQPVYQFFAAFYEIGRALGDGRFGDAKTHIAHALALGRRLQHPATDAMFLWYVYWLVHQQGQIEELAAAFVSLRAELYAAAGRPLAPADDAALSPAILAQRYEFAGTFQLAAAAYWQAETGQNAEARQSFAALADDRFANIPRDEWWTATLTLLAQVCARLGDAPRAAQLSALLAPFAGKNAAHHLVRTYGGAVSHYLGLLSASTGDAAGAARHFETALEMNERMGALPALVRTQYECARLLMGRNRGQDSRRAGDLRKRGSQLAADLGMTGLQTRFATLKPR